MQRRFCKDLDLPTEWKRTCGEYDIIIRLENLKNFPSGGGDFYFLKKGWGYFEIDLHLYHFPSSKNFLKKSVLISNLFFYFMCLQNV